MTRRQGSKLEAPAEKERVGGDYERVGLIADERGKCSIDPAPVARLDRVDRDRHGRCRRRHLSRRGLGIWIVGIEQQSDPRRRGNKLPQQTQLLRPQVGEKEVHAGRIAAGSGKARDEAEFDWIICRGEYDRNVRGRGFGR